MRRQQEIIAMYRKLIFAGWMIGASSGTLNAQDFEGDVAVSIGRAPLFSTDDEEERLVENGFKASGWIGTSFGDWRVFADINYYDRDIGAEVFRGYAPEGARSAGLHFGRNVGEAYFGGFVGRNWFQTTLINGEYNGFQPGELYGLEGQYDLGDVSFFGQFGQAEMIGTPGDTAFEGNFARVGVSATIERFSVTAEFEKGRSPDIFEDLGDGGGDYRAIGVNVDYKLTDRIIATLNYEQMDIIANDEDSGIDEYYGLGIRIPLGDSAGKRNNLTTSYRPGLATAWAKTLD
jgi:hypothetical protein